MDPFRVRTGDHPNPVFLGLPAEGADWDVFALIAFVIVMRHGFRLSALGGKTLLKRPYGVIGD
jgi:hypothetical protein